MIQERERDPATSLPHHFFCLYVLQENDFRCLEKKNQPDLRSMLLRNAADKILHWMLVLIAPKSFLLMMGKIKRFQLFLCQSNESKYMTY
jgi:hypothetical protein